MSIKIIINLSDIVSFDSVDQLIQIAKSQIALALEKSKYEIYGLRYGIETCPYLVERFSLSSIIEVNRYAENHQLSTSFVLPVIAETAWPACEPLLNYCIKQNIPIVANDFGVIEYVKREGGKLLLGRMFDKRLRDPRIGQEHFYNGLPEESGLFTDAYQEFLEREGIDVIECEALSLGLIDSVNKQNLRIHVPYNIISCGMICEYAGIGKDNQNKFHIGKCSFQCLRVSGIAHSPEMISPMIKHTNALYMPINKRTIDKAMELDNAIFIYTPLMFER